MNAEQIAERTRTVIAGIFKLSAEAVPPDASADTLENWDSLGHLNLVLALEQEFGVQFCRKKFRS